MKRPSILFLLIFLFGSLISLAQTGGDRVTLDQKIGQMLKIGFRGMEVSDSNHIVRDIRDYHLGGVVLFDYDVPSGKAVRNVESSGQLKKLVKDLKELADFPLIVSIDQEGGRVARLKPRHGFPETVSAQYLGNLDNADSTRYYSRKIAETLHDLGINVNLAPVIDVNLYTDNPVIGGIERSFSADPHKVTEHASIYIKAMHHKDILTVLKHFPGHGSSRKDSHLGVVDVTEYWSESELIPYRQLIDAGLADMIMTAHIFNARLDSVFPATLSRQTIQGVLRDSLEYSGVVMSDDMMMGAIRKHYGLETAIKQALLAGVDILSFANNSIYDKEIVPKAHAIIKRLLEEGVVSMERIDRSYERIIKMKEKLRL